MNGVGLVGAIAAICTTISFLPQVIKVYRTRRTGDLSLPMYVIFCFGVFMWTWYGIMMRSWPIIVSNAIVFVLCGYIMAMKIRYK